MLNAAYPGVHAAGMKLVTTGTAPYGDPGKGGSRIRPRKFWRIVFKKKVRFDVLAHHPYAIGGPRRGAYSKDDIAVPDVRRLVALTKAAVRRGTVLPRGRKGYWVTEIGWDSRPPDPQGVADEDLHALGGRRDVRAVEAGRRPRLLVPRPRPGARAELRRHASVGHLLRRRASASRRWRAFRFPFSCERRGGSTFVWMRAPSRKRVTVTANGRRVARVSPGGDRIATLTVPGRPRVRATAGGLRSIACRA